MKGKSRAFREAERGLAVLFEDLVMDPEDCGLLDFCRHAGIELPMRDGDLWWPTFVAHYVDSKGFDVERVAHDLATWGPIAARVRWLKQRQRLQGAK